MSLKKVCWIFSGIIAAVFGYITIPLFIAAYGWHDPAVAVLLAPLVVWLIVGLLLWWTFLHLRPLSLIKDGGSYLFRLVDDDRPIFHGFFLLNDDDIGKSLKNFKLSDLFRRYTYLPAKICRDYQRDKFLGTDCHLYAKIINLCIDSDFHVDNTRADAAMMLFYQYGNVEVLLEKIKVKIEKALDDTLTESAHLVDGELKLRTNWRKIFLGKIEDALKDELYHYDGNSGVFWINVA